MPVRTPFTDGEVERTKISTVLTDLAGEAMRVTGAVAAAMYWSTGDALSLAAVARDGVRIRDGAGTPPQTTAAQAVLQQSAFVEVDATAPAGTCRQWLAVPIFRDEKTIGAVTVSTVAAAGFADHAPLVLELVAARVAPMLLSAELEEAERRSRLARTHAHWHLALLAQGSRTLGQVIDNEEAALRALAGVLVGEFADWCGIDLVRDGKLTRIAYAHVDDAANAGAGDLLAQHPGWSAPVDRVVASGRSELAWDVAAPSESEDDADHVAVAKALDLRSCLIVPIRIQGLSIGAITCATTPYRRGYRQSDVQVMEELAARTATAIERMSLYRETQRAAIAATERARQLRRLTNAALAIQPQHRTEDVAAVLAHQARSVLGAQHAAVTISGGRQELRTTAGDPEAWHGAYADLLDRADVSSVAQGVTLVDDVTGTVQGLAVRLNGRSGLAIGTLAVAGRTEGPFDADDESILVALAQLGSAALENVRLYETVRAGEERLLALIDAAPVAVLELDAMGLIVRSNSAALQILGDGPGSEDRLHDDTAALLRRVATDAVAGQPVGDLEVVGRRTDGSEIPLAIAAAVLRDTSGDVNGVLVMASDQTTRRQLEEQLARAQRIEAVGQVAGGVAHDFNNLLTVILGHAAILGAVLLDDDDRSGDVRAITMAAERAAGVTAQLLTISRGDLVPTEVFDPRERISRLAETVRSFLPAFVVFDVAIDPGDALIRMSPAQFDQVVLNLAINARDAMKDAGTLTVRIRDADAVVVSITDTGTGMDSETADRCFEPFFSTKGGERGTGLGLATVRSLVEGAGGSIALDTEPGFGTTFTIRLPRAVDPSVRVDDVRTQPSRGSERILLVEDQVGLRRLAVEVLRSAGYEVMPATDGQFALDMLEAANEFPDLLLTDVVMPRMGGVELANRLRADHPDLPVLFMTGYIDEASREGIQNADVLIKPFVISDLVERVRTALDRAASTTR